MCRVLKKVVLRVSRQKKVQKRQESNLRSIDVHISVSLKTNATF